MTVGLDGLTGLLSFASCIDVNAISNADFWQDYDGDFSLMDPCCCYCSMLP